MIPLTLHNVPTNIIPPPILYLTPLLPPRTSAPEQVFAVLPERQGLMLMEHADGVSVDEIRKKTDAPFVLSPALRPMLQ